MKKIAALTLAFILLFGLTTFATPTPRVTEPATEVTEPVAEITEPVEEITEPVAEVTEPATEETIAPEDIELNSSEEPAPEITPEDMEPDLPEEPSPEIAPEDIEIAPEEPAPEEEFYGEWYGNVIGLTVCLTLQEGGIYTVTFPETSQEGRQGTWVLKDGFIYMDEERIPSISALNQVLAWTASGTMLTLEKEETYAPAPAHSDAMLDAFSGYWKSAYVEMDGALVYASSIQNNTDIYIEGTNVALGGPLFGDVIEVFAFADGKLIYQDGDDSTNVQIEMQILEDGMLALTLTGNAVTYGVASEMKIFLAPAYTEYLAS